MRADKHGRDGSMGSRRQNWRDKSHQESHSQPGLDCHSPLTAHPLASQDPPVMVTTSQGLAEMIDHLQTAGAFAFDSEFIGERSYEPHLCLMQTATTQRVFIVDPLVGLDLSEFWELLACPTVEKIVLAGQQDFGPAVQQTGLPPANIMDVQIAAGFIHGEYPLSLARLLLEFVGVSLGKGMTFTHWDKRPLSAVQVRYAADDVRYLPAAREVIGRRLADCGRTAWAREECAAALEDMLLYRSEPQTLYLRVRGRDRLGRRGLAILRELAIWRDQAARQEDVPMRTLLKDGIVVAMARRPVRTLADLDGIAGLPRPVESRYGPQIVEATARAMALPEDQLPPAEPSEKTTFGDRVDTIYADLSQFCQEQSVAPSLVASRKDVTRACRAAGAGQSLAQHRLLRGWRKELVGGLLEKLL